MSPDQHGSDGQTGTPQIDTREQLVWALHRAAEIEHLLMCLYLSTAFSCKQAGEPGITGAQSEQVRRWEANILMVARQEMEHLALVNNLLIGMGEKPYVSRPNLPLRHYLLDNPALSFVIEPFRLTSIGRYVLFEAPDDWGEKDYGIDKALVEQCVAADPCTSGVRLWSALDNPVAAPNDARAEPMLNVSSVQDLYNAIDQAIKNKEDLPALRNLFQGRPGKEPYQDFQFNLQFNIFTFPVTDISSARAAIALILEQGEGLRSQPGFSSHFHRFATIFKDLIDEHGEPRFEPAWNMVCNPSKDTISNQDALALMDLFNDGYVTMMYMLASFYTYFSPTSYDTSLHHISTALQSTVFAPMMTMFIRPLGEIICRLPAEPAGADQLFYAGPNWHIPPGDLPFQPHEQASFFSDRLFSLADQLGKFAGEGAYNDATRKRLVFMHETFTRVARNFYQMVQQ